MCRGRDPVGDECVATRCRKVACRYHAAATGAAAVADGCCMARCEPRPDSRPATRWARKSRDPTVGLRPGGPAASDPTAGPEEPRPGGRVWVAGAVCQVWRGRL
jgi:hypothetical protein